MYSQYFCRRRAQSQVVSEGFGEIREVGEDILFLGMDKEGYPVKKGWVWGRKELEVNLPQFSF